MQMCHQGQRGSSSSLPPRRESSRQLPFSSLYHKQRQQQRQQRSLVWEATKPNIRALLLANISVPGAFDDLGQKHFACTEEVAHNIHTIHQRTFYHLQRGELFLKQNIRS